MLFAQAGQWWDLISAQIIMWAAAVAAVSALARAAWRSSEFLRLLIVNAASIGTTPQWPNGSTDLPSSLTEIYRRQGETHDLLESHIGEFEDHIDMHRG